MWLTIILACVLVLGPSSAEFVPQQAALWNVAVGAELRLEGQWAEAVRHLTAAIAWTPHSAPLYARRSQWKREAGDLSGSLEDAQTAIRLAPDDPEGYTQRGLTLQKMGQFEDAIADWQKLLQLERDRLAERRANSIKGEIGSSRHDRADRLGEYLNGLAYAKALADVDLAEALREVTTAIRRDGRRAAYLDTRGFVRYVQGDLQGALEDLHPAVRQIEAARRKTVLQLLRQKRQSLVDLRQQRLMLKQVDESVAVIRYHRGLALEALGQKEQAVEDFQRVRELGYEPNEQLF